MASGQAACRLCGRAFDPYGGRSRVYCKKCTAKADRAIARAPVVQCKECGKRFSTPSRSIRYCSDACRTASTRRCNLEYQRKYQTDPEKRATAMARTRIAAAARRARARGGRPPPPPPRGAKKAEPSACRLCGRMFAPYGGARTVHCKRCRARAEREVARVLRVDCKTCGGKFSTTNRSVRYCSDGCRAEGLRRCRRESKRRVKADPERRALASAQTRARNAARRDRAPG